MLRSVRAAIAIALLAARASGAESAATAPSTPPSTAPPSAADDLQPAFLQIVVNGVLANTALVLVGPDDVWVPPAELTGPGLSRFAGARRDVDGRTYVSLRSLAPDLRFDLDPVALAVRIEAGKALLGRGAVDLRSTFRPPGLELDGAPSAFVNYAGRATTANDLSGVLEAGISRGDALLLGSVSADRLAGPVRGLTALTVDDPRRLVRTTVGDAIVPADPLSGAPVIGGFGYARELSIDPYFVQSPLPRATAFAATPSTVEVYVNGALSRTLQVAPGTYDLSNLPVTAGANDVRIVVRDAFGRVQTIDAAHYQAQGLLAKGLHTFGWWAGARRETFGTSSFDYGSALVVGRHRYGFAETFTGGLRLELGPWVQQGSVSATLGLGRSELEATAAASADRGAPGAAGLLAWRVASRRLSFGADASLSTREYATSTLRAAQDRALWRAGAYASLPVGPDLSVQLQYTVDDRRDHGLSQGLTARSTLQLAPRAWLLLSAGATRAGAARPVGEVMVQLVVAAPDGSTFDAGLHSSTAATGASSGAQRALPTGPGYGYRVRADSAGDGSFSGLAQAQAGFGRYEAGWDRTPTTSIGSVTAAGALVAVGGRVFATRPVEQSFALVRVPGVAGVRASLDRRPMGRTDADGDLLVPGLLPYYGNRLSIDDADVPASYRIGKTERLVAAPHRGAAVVRFDVAPLRAVEGWVSIARASGAEVPAYGTLEADVPGGVRRSPIAEDGNFWLEDVPAGRHAARVYWHGEVCELVLEVPQSSTGVLEVGDVACRPSTSM